MNFELFFFELLLATGSSDGLLKGDSCTVLLGYVGSKLRSLEQEGVNVFVAFQLNRLIR